LIALYYNKPLWYRVSRLVRVHANTIISCISIRIVCASSSARVRYASVRNGTIWIRFKCFTWSFSDPCSFNACTTRNIINDETSTSSALVRFDFTWSRSVGIREVSITIDGGNISLNGAHCARNAQLHPPERGRTLPKNDVVSLRNLESAKRAFRWESR
jgi:hypothetical protein